MKSIWSLLFIATVADAWCDRTSSWLCLPEHPQTSFCKADYVIRVQVISKIQTEQWPLQPEKVPPPPPTPEPPREKQTNVVIETDINEVEPTVEIRPTPSSPNPSRWISFSGLADPPSLPPRLPKRKVRHARGLVSSSFGLGGGRKFQRYSSHSVRYQEVIIKRVMKGRKILENLEGVVKSKDNRVMYARVYVSCVDLKPGRPYLLMGKVIKNRLWLSSCNVHTDWESVTIDQRRALKKYYNMNCDCRVEFCYYPDCQKETIKDGCRWRPRTFPPSTDCGVKHRYCKQKKNGQCVWIDGNNYNRCVRDLWPF